MINYLTTKNRLLVAILAFILPFSFANGSLKFEITAKRLYAASQRVL